MQVYKCSGCGFEKNIMHIAKGKRKAKKDGSPTKFCCPLCKDEIFYKEKEISSKIKPKRK